MVWHSVIQLRVVAVQVGVVTDLASTAIWAGFMKNAIR
jgi:hypothetical protein